MNVENVYLNKFVLFQGTFYSFVNQQQTRRKLLLNDELDYHRPIWNMAATNYHKLIFVKQTNEPIREKEHVDI